MRGVLRYRREDVVAILDSTRAGETEDGVPVVGNVEEALPAGADDGAGRSRDPGRVLPACVDGAAPELRRARSRRRERPPRLPRRRPGAQRARRASAASSLRDLRRPPADLSTATGENLSVDATIVLTVGSDCAIGKMTVSCELDLEARRRGIRSVFVPTGQTGMAIAGWGIAVDAVVADFLAGAAERLVVEGRDRGGELLWVEGQGSLLHPVYSGVALGLYHGSVAAPARALPRGRPDADRGRRRRPAPDPAAARARRAARAARAAGASGAGRRRRAQHECARARRRRVPRSRRRKTRRGYRPTTRFASEPPGWSTQCLRPRDGRLGVSGRNARRPLADHDPSVASAAPTRRSHRLLPFSTRRLTYS